ncbi:hypothetical protein [Deinococcus hohokamensis]|uniref:Lipoprotein n=1 Tax=Deinococcus hohokamensis TaxID=309883 RepID=A0ABV9I8Z0_9DEIO
MNLKILATALITASLLAACGGGETPVVTPTPDPTSFGTLTTLKPGARAEINQKLKINIVNIGYGATSPGQVTSPRDLNFSDMAEQLPATYRTINRYPSFYGNNELTGNNFEFDYNYVTASQAFQDEFFKFLMDKGSEKSVVRDGVTYTDISSAFYNCQSNDLSDTTRFRSFRPTGEDTPVYACLQPAGNIARQITGSFEVDGEKVEQWLAANAGRTGVDTSEHTIFLINWYGRGDFKFHTYSHERADAIETDTKVNFGARSSRRTVAWGGTPATDQTAAKRVWFYDQSANPDYWTSAWNISSGDIDGDGVYDKRMVPIWEYGTRKSSVAYAEKISKDLGLVTRYVGINLLFTPSALYRVDLTPPDMPEHINVDLALEQGADAVAGEKVIQPAVAQQRLSALNPFIKWSNSLRTTALDGDLADAYRCFFPLETDDACSPDYADAEGERFFQLATAEIRQRAAATPGQYNLPTYLFNDSDPETPNFGLLGQAINDGVTGTQTMTLNFLTPDLNAAGYGFTDTAVHEGGHHLSQSHPHDGYDSERNEDYGPSGDTSFVDVGDEVHSVMSYNNLAKVFGQFNLDAQYRYLTTAYMSNANAILTLTQNAGKVPDVRAAAQSADQAFKSAVAAYNARQYYTAAQLAHTGYRAVLDAAKGAGVSVEGYKWYDRVGQLSTSTVKARAVNHMRPVQGPTQRPEETPAQRAKRLAP